MGKSGLIWVGEQFYKTQEDFLREARSMGISRRVSVVPKGFKLGTWVLLAHRRGVPHQEDIPDGLFAEFEVKQTRWIPAIFSVFKPFALEYVVKGGETEEELERLVRRGLTPVKVEIERRAY